MKLIQGDCLEVLKTLEPDSIDSLVTDPPAGISFMGKEWDHHKGGRKEWCAWMESVMRECIRVMKPGAHGLVWALPRTSHWTATALEDAGFRIVDRIQHVFGSGFPKSTNVGKQAYKAGILCQCVANETKTAETELSEVRDRDSTEGTQGAEQAEVLLDEVRRCCEGLESKVCCSPTGDCTQRPCRMDGEESGERVREDERKEQPSVDGRSLRRASEGLRDDSQSCSSKGQTERLCVGAYSSDGEEAESGTIAEGSCASHRPQSAEQSSQQSNALLGSQDALGGSPQSGLHCRKCGLLSKEAEGFGSHLKPATEDWWLIQKPREKGLTIAANVLKWGTGALNIDSGRIPTTDKLQKLHGSFTFSAGEGADAVGKKIDYIESGLGRFPSHLILDEEAGKMLDAQSGTLKTGAHTGRRSGVGYHGGDGTRAGSFLRPANEGGASRFFYCAKVSASERNAGLDRSELVWNQGVWENAVLLSSMESASQLAKGISDTLMQHLESKSWSTDLYGQSISEQYPQGFKSIIETVLKLITELRTSNSSLHSNTKESILVALKMIEASGLSLVDAVAFSKKLNLATISDQTALLLSASNALLCELEKIRRFVVSGNFHSTVKPQKLMRYLCKLITPPGGTILDPFMGSGSTGLAAKSEGFEFVGIEREPEYFEIANARVGTSKNL